MSSFPLPLLVYFAIALVFAFISARSAAEQGRSRWLWGIFGFLIGPLIMLLPRIGARGDSETGQPTRPAAPDPSEAGQSQTQSSEPLPRPSERLVQTGQGRKSRSCGSFGRILFPPGTSAYLQALVRMERMGSTQRRRRFSRPAGDDLSRRPWRRAQSTARIRILAASRKARPLRRAGNVGVSYEMGISVPQDRIEAGYWRYLSCAAGNAAGNAVYNSRWLKLSDDEKDALQELIAARYFEIGADGDQDD